MAKCSTAYLRQCVCAMHAQTAKETHQQLTHPLSRVQKSLDKYVGILCEARKKKGLTEQQARDSLQDMNVYGTLMVLAGDADGMVSGATSTTANTIRPALQVSHHPPKCHIAQGFRV